VDHTFGVGVADAVEQLTDDFADFADFVTGLLREVFGQRRRYTRMA
jgi:hypothetical protein